MIITPFFPRRTSYSRYGLFKKLLNFANNGDYDLKPHPNSKLNRIWAVFHNLEEKCKKLYAPGRDVTVIERLLLYKA
jgi:hypothetical protein